MKCETIRTNKFVFKKSDRLFKITVYYIVIREALYDHGVNISSIWEAVSRKGGNPLFRLNFFYWFTLPIMVM